MTYEFAADGTGEAFTTAEECELHAFKVGTKVYKRDGGIEKIVGRITRDGKPISLWSLQRFADNERRKRRAGKE